MIWTCDIDKLAWLRWMFERGKIGWQRDGWERAVTQARRVEA